MIGGNRDGASSPGVGAAETDVQGELVALAMLVTVGSASGVAVGEGVQEENERRRTNDAARYFLN